MDKPATTRTEDRSSCHPNDSLPSSSTATVQPGPQQDGFASHASAAATPGSSKKRKRPSRAGLTNTNYPPPPTIPPFPPPPGWGPQAHPLVPHLPIYWTPPFPSEKKIAIAAINNNRKPELSSPQPKNDSESSTDIHNGNNISHERHHWLKRVQMNGYDLQNALNIFVVIRRS